MMIDIEALLAPQVFSRSLPHPTIHSKGDKHDIF